MKQVLTIYFPSGCLSMQPSRQSMRASLRNGSFIQTNRISCQHHSVSAHSVQCDAEQSTSEDFDQTWRTCSYHLSRRWCQVDFRQEGDNQEEHLLFPFHRHHHSHQEEKVGCKQENYSSLLIIFLLFSEESYLVFDYCQRSLLQVSSGDIIPQLPAKDINQVGKYIMFMSLLENCIGKPIDLVSFCFSSKSSNLFLKFFVKHQLE